MFAYFALVGTAIVLWLPIVIRFFLAWRRRKNPVSLAIAALIFLSCWEGIGRVWVLRHTVDETVAIYAFTALSAVVALNFHLAFYWSGRRFRDSRDQ